MVEQGFQELKRLWDPVWDLFDEAGVKFALEIHPGEIAFDYWSAKKLIDVVQRDTLGFNFDPSHLVWQGIEPSVLIRDFPERIYHGRRCAQRHSRLPYRVRRSQAGMEFPIPGAR